MTGASPPLIWSPAAGAPADRARIGGKGYHLARLEAAGQPVPPWYAVTSDAFRRLLRSSGRAERIERRLAEAGDGLREAAAEIRGWVLALEPPPELAAAVAAAHAERIPGGAPCAVRSSALGEDSAADSFAGLHDSFLFVHGEEEILAAIRSVWASAFNERALAYRRARSIPWAGVSIAVLVQQMVDAAASGVAFTANPNSGDVYQVVVSALYGAGEGLVSAGLDADTYVVDKDSREVESTIVDKPDELVPDRSAGRGLRQSPVEPGRRERAALSDAELHRVVDSALAIERALGRPQDIEFSFDREGRLFVLQTRPVTTVEELGPAAGNRLLWDNSNIIESYSGVTSPMTFSFIRRAYTIVYHCFAQVMGIDAETVRKNRRVFENMLGLFRGQVYYNLLNWYALIRLFPGFNYNKRFMESMMGVGQAVSGAEEPPAPGWRRRYLVELPALLRLVFRSGRNFLRIRKLVSDFESHFQKVFGRWSALDLSTLAPHELRALYLEMEEELLWNWKAPIINDFFVMISYGTLKALCARWCGDEGSLQNDLICGEGGIESTKPTRMLLELAAQASRDPELRAFLLAGEPEELAAALPHDPRFAGFYAGIERYLELYGFRCVNELKLEEFSLKDRPAFLYQVLRNYLQMGDAEQLDPAAAEAREAGIRRQAEERAFAAIGRGPHKLFHRILFRRVLANARLGVKNRENMRFARTRIYGLLRELLRALGERFAAEGILERRDDIFYLALDEAWDFIKGTAVTTDLKGLAELRRAEFAGFRDDRERMPDDRFTTFGMAYHRNRFKSRQAAGGETEEGVLRGTGCCPGEVTEAVKVLRSPSDDARLAGEILVAERTDPGWVPLYPAVSGILIERGSILSHSAIVAREMGIPTIVGIPGLTGALATGERVTMDGAAGTVRRAEPELSPPPSSE